ncbi:MAG TPA: hypothetical protein VFK41_02545 [Nocardioidaceae bacterium]|nr:hypothetical protein [Nocardioidaceae bacterium]
MRFSQVIVAGALLLAVGCTGDVVPDTRPTPTGPTITDIPATRTPTATPPPVDVADALLQKGHLGRKFAPGLTTDPSFHTVYDDPEGRFGCLRALDEIDFGVPAEDSALAVYDARNDAKSPHIVNLVGRSESEEAAAEGFLEALTILDSCQRVRSRSEDSRVDARVETTRVPVLPAIHEQLDIRTTGRLRVLTSSFPIGIWVSVLRVDEYVAVVSVLDLGRDGAESQRALTAVVAERLAALVAGKGLPPVRLVPMGTRLPQ